MFCFNHNRDTWFRERELHTILKKFTNRKRLDVSENLRKKIVWKFKLSILRRFCGLLNKDKALTSSREDQNEIRHPLTHGILQREYYEQKLLILEQHWGYTKGIACLSHVFTKSCLPEPLWEFQKLVINVTISKKKPEFEWYKTQTFMYILRVLAPEHMQCQQKLSLSQLMLLYCHPNILKLHCYITSIKN